MTHYTIAIDWKGETFYGITLKWDYNQRKVDLSMPGYIKKALLKFQHIKPTKSVDAAYKHTPIIYGAKQQYLPLCPCK